MAFDTSTVTVKPPPPAPAPTGVASSGFFQNLLDGKGYTPLELWIGEVPGTATT